MTVMTVETVETVKTANTVEIEDLKKYRPLTDNLKARDASASKNSLDFPRCKCQNQFCSLDFWLHCNAHFSLLHLI